ncbi:hypothetical protein E6H19_02070 [Candidatus Bathyarchaeota archaeon]|nr:MAG: hypothetical protein E6H19_02070 [Candidatus Bathyarchaeota archaeon]
MLIVAYHISPSALIEIFLPRNLVWKTLVQSNYCPGPELTRRRDPMRSIILLRMLMLLPLLVLVGFELTLFSNFPYAWKLGGCHAAGLGACYPVSYDWANFEIDMAFYTLLSYWLVVANGVRQRLFTTLPQQGPVKKTLLTAQFKLALLGGLLMFAIPIITFSSLASTGYSSRHACLVPSPCQTQADQLAAAWRLTTAIGGYSTGLTILVAALGVTEKKWHRLLSTS